MDTIGTVYVVLIKGRCLCFVGLVVYLHLLSLGPCPNFSTLYVMYLELEKRYLHFRGVLCEGIILLPP